MSLDIDAAAFNKRVHLIQKLLPQLDNAKALVTVLGKGDAETQKQLTSGLHLWLLSVPFANTCIVITKEKCIIIAAVKQTKHLESLKSDSVRVVTRGKDPQECTQLLSDLLSKENEVNLSEDDKIALFSQDNPESNIAVAFKEAYAKYASVDASSEFRKLLEVKEESELRAVRMAARTASGLASQVFVDKMSSILDEDRKVSNKDLAKSVADSIDNLKLLQKLKIGSDFNPAEIDWAKTPDVNGNSDDNIQQGVINVELFPSYHAYVGGLARTYLVNANSQQVANYQLLLAAQRKAIQSSIAGSTAENVYKVALDHIEQKNPELAKHLEMPIGYCVGLITDDSLDIKEGNTKVLADNQTLFISLTLKDIKDESGKLYTLRIGDTLRVNDQEPIVFTDAPKNSSEIAFELEDSIKQEPKVKQERGGRNPGAPGNRLARTTRSSEKREINESAERALEEHQAELKARLQEHGEQKYATAEDNEITDSGPVFRKFESYKREMQLPKIGNLKIAVDQRASTIILPISGRPIPFHINTFRSGSTTDEGKYVYLRLNFNSPDSLMTKRDNVPYDNPNAQFLKSITLRSRDGERMRETLKKIQEMKKETTRKENERKQLADVVQQEKLIEARDRRPLRLDTLFVRPGPEGKRIPGAIEIHKNGIRYSSPIREQTVEVLFSNVEHLFFQPNDHELITLIHFHLRNPIMIGKRKTKDVQFYRDATDMTADDTGHRKRRYRYGDEDELEQEEEERRFRVRLNKDFFKFAEEISKASNGQLDVDSPFRELGFNGVPYRANMYLQPTTNCLVQLSETPFYVVTLNDVELAVLERVRFGLKQFDLVFIFKDYKRPVSQINSIPMTQLDAVKSWLNEVDIPFYEAELNFNWKEVMNTINSSPHQFFINDGGWSFLDPEVPPDGEVEVDESEGGEDEFSVSDEDPDDESGEYSEEDDDDVSGSDFSESEGGDDDVSEGEDWSDLEEKAKQSDRKKEKDF